MVGGGSIFGKYLWRVETTELERTYSISVSLSLSLSLCLSLSLSLSLSLIRPLCTREAQDVCFAIRIPFEGAWKIAWECWRHRERHIQAFKRNVDPDSDRCVVHAEKKVRHRCYFRREWPRRLEALQLSSIAFPKGP